MALRERVIRLAFTQPELRKHLLPLLREARTLDLSHYGLEGLLEGRPVTLYHGTTRQFAKFDLSRSRTELVNQFYGAGIFLTPSKRVAWKYAYANRNIGFEPEVIDDLARVNRPAAEFLRDLYEKGDEVWDEYGPARFGVAPEEYLDTFEQALGGVDPNTVADLAQWVIGSKVKPLGGDEPVHIFNMSTGMPSWAYDLLDKLGLDSKTYRPKVYTVEVTAQKTLVTANKSQARAARSKGYDAVVFHGSDLVDGVPEVAVFDPHRVRVVRVEVDD